MSLIIIALELGAMYCGFQAFCAIFELLVWNHEQKSRLRRQQALRMKRLTEGKG
jgi:hypothetical protein